ncbi:MFS transporter [Maritalea mobilis]|uniref:MFS transporter n=1 Tax=Maritalea mobilis TaxID=483324 RepID=UPI001C93D89E|nr:MFS transporter [Maritalea mobilis]MBY6201397.1 MFS transporter [Maritalea mobilis]
MQRLSDLLNAAILSRAPIAALAAIGVFWGGTAAYIPDLKARIGAGDALFGMILLASSGGALIAMAISPRVEARLPRAALTLSVVAMAAAAAPLGWAASVALFSIAMVAVGMTTGMADILANARVARLEARHNTALMNLNHACYSFAYAASAALTGIAREAALSPALWFVLIAAATLALASFTWPRMSQQAEGDAPQASRGHVGRHAWIAGFVVLIAFFVENATEGWSALHVERTLGGGAAEGALGPAMLGLTMGIGRLLGQMVTFRGSEMTVLRFAVLIAAAGLIIAASAPVPILAYLGFGLLGLGVSVVAPLALALTGVHAEPERRTLAVSRAAMIGYFGFFIGPPLMGFLSEAVGLRIAFATGAAMLLIVPLLLLPRMRAAERMV